jgi:hypothetical protein
MSAETAQSAPTGAAQNAQTGSPGGSVATGTRPRKGGLRRLVASLVRIVDLQYRIWLTHAKLTLQRMILYAALFGIAMILAILALIFLYIGCFHVLTDLLGFRPVWAYLFFGIIHLALAGALVVVGTAILAKKDGSTTAGPPGKGEST